MGPLVDQTKTKGDNKRCKGDIRHAQFEFRQGLSTRKGIVVTHVLVQNCYDQIKDVSIFHKTICLCHRFTFLKTVSVVMTM